MAIGGNALRDTPSDNARGPEEGFRRCAITLLAQENVYQMPRTIHCTVQIGPAPFHFDVGFVDIPALSTPSPPMLAQHLAE
jgi:hypothetical protein